MEKTIMDSDSHFIILRRHLLKGDHENTPLRVVYTNDHQYKRHRSYVTRYLTGCKDINDLLIEEIDNGKHVKTYLASEWLKCYKSST